MNTTFCIIIFFVGSVAAVYLDDCICYFFFFLLMQVLCVCGRFQSSSAQNRRRTVCEMRNFSLCGCLSIKTPAFQKFSCAFLSIPFDLMMRTTSESCVCEKERDAVQWVGFTSRHMFCGCFSHMHWVMWRVIETAISISQNAERGEKKAMHFTHIKMKKKKTK